MKISKAAALMALVAISCGSLAATSADSGMTAEAYLRPDLKVGERLGNVFSKADSIQGTGFKEHVSRISGSADYTVTAVTPQAITLDSGGRYDGYPPHVAHGYRILADGITACYQGKCKPDDETSGLVFNRLLWGSPPEQVHAGSHWALKIDKPWEIGPAGTEQVRVVSVDPVNGEITLARHGSGNGPSSDELRLQQGGKPIEITTTDGKKLDVALIPGHASWEGFTTVRRGVIIGDEIMVTQQVKLVSKDGRTFHGELRAYTLLDLAYDRS